LWVGAAVGLCGCVLGVPDTREQVCEANAPPSWSDAFLGVYGFEDETDLGKDSTAGGHHLQPGGSPRFRAADAPQGMATLDLQTEGDGLLSNDSAFSLELLTFGGWFRVTAAGNRAAIGKYSPSTNAGYMLARGDANATARCHLEGDSTNNVANSWPLDQWRHQVCVLGMGEGRQLTDGTFQGGDSGMQPIVDPGEPFRISLEAPADTGAPTWLVGEVDEVFVHAGRLGDAAIRRIWACGIDGCRCSCNPDDPAQFVSCGRAAPDCAGLPPCHIGSPPLE
jgi:hypothetical protein